MKTICIRTKIKKEYLSEVKEWFQNLKIRINEVKQTLKNEKVIVESAFLDTIDGQYYLIHYMKAENIEYAYKVFEKSNLPIDQYYKDCWKKYCVGRVVLEELLDIDLIDSTST